MEFGISTNGLGKCTLVRKPDAVGKDANMLAQSTLLVEHIAAHVWPFAEQAIERIADRRAPGLQRAIGHNLP